MGNGGSKRRPTGGPERATLARATLALAGTIVAIGAAALVGWFLHIEWLKAVIPGLTTMKVNTALSFIAGGVAVALIDHGSRPAKAWASAFTAFMGLLALATLVEYVAGLDLGIDELIVLDPDTTSLPFNGRMSPVTAMAFVASACSLCLLALGASRRAVVAAHLLAAIPAAIGFLALTGYGYGVEGLYNFGRFVTLAVHTAFAFVCLAIAMLMTRRQEGWEHQFLDRPIARSALLQVSLVSILTPYFTGFLIILGMRRGFYQAAYSPAPFVIATVLALIGLAFRWARILAGAEQELEHARRHAAESGERLDLALSCGRSVGTWNWDVAADRVVADERFAQLYGVDPRRARQGAPIGEFLTQLHPEDLPALRSALARALESGDSFAQEYRLLQPDGGVLWVLSEGRCHRSATGSPQRFPGVSFDITDRKLAETQLLQLNADLERRVIELARELGRTWQVSPDLLGVIDAGGCFETSNPAWEVTLGWTHAEVASTRFLDFVHPDDRARTEEAWLAATERGLPALRFENRYRQKSGDYRWLSWVAVPEQGKVYCSARDVTGEKERAQALERAEEALRQSQKMEAVGQLTGGIAHDFNNLLAGIGGSLEMLRSRLAQGRPEAAERYLAAGLEGVRRAASVTHRLLAFSRRQTLDPKPTDANRLVAGMAELVTRAVGPEIAVETVAAEGLWLTLVDRNQLENALLNLCINARDAMPEGGRLTVETTNHQMDERTAPAHDLPPGQYISICVSDIGVGMSPDVAARAFDPFFTTKPFGEGTGLGLSMVYGFVRQSEGQIGIQSTPGQGTTICLYLPRHHGEPATEADMLPASADLQAGRTVLVVDDEQTIRMLITDVLEESGYRPLEAVDGPAALRILESPQPIDLLITDVGLPGGLNGRQLADAARISRPDLKILFITGYSETAAIGNNHLDRTMQVVTKPFALETLAKKIQEMTTP